MTTMQTETSYAYYKRTAHTVVNGAFMLNTCLLTVNGGPLGIEQVQTESMLIRAAMRADHEKTLQARKTVDANAKLLQADWRFNSYTSLQERYKTHKTAAQRALSFITQHVTNYPAQGTESN